MKVKHIGLSMNPQGPKNWQPTDTVAHPHFYPSLLQSNGEFSLVWIILARVGKKKDLHLVHVGRID